jgi:hypothetical protein
MDPFFQRAFTGRMANSLGQYQASLAHGQPAANTALDYVRQNGVLGGF